MNIDLYLFNLINNLALQWYWLDFLGFLIFKYSEYFLVLGLAILLIVNFKNYWKIILKALFAGFLARLITEVMRQLWFRERPFVSNNVNLFFDYSQKESSFPSAHAGFYFALSTVIYLFNKKLGIIFYIASIAVSLNRVFVGIHWPSDILVGAILGVLVGFLSYSLLSKIT